MQQLYWRPLLSRCRWAHFEQSSTICNRISISTDFSEKIENWTVSKNVHNCQSSVTQYFVTWLWSFFTYVTIMVGNSFTDWLTDWAEVTFLPLRQPKLILDSVIPEGCKGELTWMVIISQDSLPVTVIYITNNQAVPWLGVKPATASHESGILTIRPPS